MSIAAVGTAAVSPGRGIAITPDGARVVYVGNRGTQLFVQVLDQLEATPLVTGVAPLNWLMLSPDGAWVGFIEGSQVKKIAITGGPASSITANTSANLTGAAWVADDTIVLASGDPATGLVQVSASGGDQTVLTRPDPSKGERDHLWPEPLPGGRSVLFTITATTGGPKASQIAVLDLTTRTVTVVASGGSDARYVSSGHLVYVTDGAMRAIAFDLDGLKTRGDAVTVLPRFRSAEGASEFHVSAKRNHRLCRRPRHRGREYAGLG
jgi:serine/threonine-protein kinase